MEAPSAFLFMRNQPNRAFFFPFIVGFLWGILSLDILTEVFHRNLWERVETFLLCVFFTWGFFFFFFWEGTWGFPYCTSLTWVFPRFVSLKCWTCHMRFFRVVTCVFYRNGSSKFSFFPDHKFYNLTISFLPHGICGQPP